MQIEKAIEIKEAYHKKYFRGVPSSEADADRLSIEALKWIKVRDTFAGQESRSLLLGETKD